MGDRCQKILLKEMVFDLLYRLRLADELFCHAAESLVSASALENWTSRSEALREIRGYSQALRIIHEDNCRILDDRHAIFPADLEEWIFDRPDGEIPIQLHLKRLHAIAEGMELALHRELLKMEAAK